MCRCRPPSVADTAARQPRSRGRGATADVPAGTPGPTSVLGRDARILVDVRDPLQKNQISRRGGRACGRGGQARTWLAWRPGARLSKGGGQPPSERTRSGATSAWLSSARPRPQATSRVHPLAFWHLVPIRRHPQPVDAAAQESRPAAACVHRGILLALRADPLRSLRYRDHYPNPILSNFESGSFECTSRTTRAIAGTGSRWPCRHQPALARSQQQGVGDGIRSGRWRLVRCEPSHSSESPRAGRCALAPRSCRGPGRGDPQHEPAGEHHCSK